MNLDALTSSVDAGPIVTNPFSRLELPVEQLQGVEEEFEYLCRVVPTLLCSQAQAVDPSRLRSGLIRCDLPHCLEATRASHVCIYSGVESRMPSARLAKLWSDGTGQWLRDRQCGLFYSIPLLPRYLYDMVPKVNFGPHVVGAAGRPIQRPH